TMIATRAMDSRAFLAWVNLVGGQDELVFDGNSLFFDPDGELVAHAASFEEEMLVADLDIGSVFGGRLHDTRLRKEAATPSHLDLEVSEVVVTEEAPPRPAGTHPNPVTAPLDGPAEVYAALVCGTRDYVTKSGLFQKVLLGLSGGVDSSLTATVAVDALGQENVIGVLMPSRFTPPESLEDARQLAEPFAGNEPGLAEENIQARIRGNLLMAMSNKYGWMVLTTGNKSELANGYCTLYGDMVGGFAVLKDILKTTVYELARYRNSLQ